MNISGDVPPSEEPASGLWPLSFAPGTVPASSDGQALIASLPQLEEARNRRRTSVGGEAHAVENGTRSAFEKESWEK